MTLKELAPRLLEEAQRANADLDAQVAVLERALQAVSEENERLKDLVCLLEVSERTLPF